MQGDPRAGGFSEQIVGDAAGDGEVQQLSAVEALAAAARFGRPVDDHGERSGGPQGRGSALDGDRGYFVSAHPPVPFPLGAPLAYQMTPARITRPEV
jgi:hypothetical protein